MCGTGPRGAHVCVWEIWGSGGPHGRAPLSSLTLRFRGRQDLSPVCASMRARVYVCTHVCECAQKLVGVQGPVEALDSSARWPEARLCLGRGQTQRGVAAGGGGSQKVAPEKQLGTEERSRAGTLQLSRDLGRVQP